MTRRFTIGTKFGKWTVVGPSVRGGASGKTKWLCQCVCKTVAYVTTGNLVNGRSTGCPTCGKSKPNNSLDMPSLIYQRLSCIARGAIRRCTNAAYPQWKDYGGRGIKVFDEWVEDYRKFVEYLYTLPGVEDDSLELDRENNNGNYEPGNLRFVTRSVSMQNRRCSRKER